MQMPGDSVREDKAKPPAAELGKGCGGDLNPCDKGHGEG